MDDYVKRKPTLFESFMVFLWFLCEGKKVIKMELFLFHRYTDMESEDYSFYQGLVFLTENNVSDLGYDLTFSTEVRMKLNLTHVQLLRVNHNEFHRKTEFFGTK